MSKENDLEMDKYILCMLDHTNEISISCQPILWGNIINEPFYSFIDEKRYCISIYVMKGDLKSGIKKIIDIKQLKAGKPIEELEKIAALFGIKTDPLPKKKSWEFIKHIFNI